MIVSGGENVMPREVEELISAHLKPPAAPRLLLDLMDNGWRDLLVLMHLKEGTESISWSEQTDALDKLSGWLGDMQSYIVAAAIALVTTPLVVSQLDG